MHGRVKNTLLSPRSAVKWNKKCAHCYYYTPPFVVVYNLIYSIIYNIGFGNDLFRLVSWGWRGVVGPSLWSFSNSIPRNVSVERLWGKVVEKNTFHHRLYVCSSDPVGGGWEMHVISPSPRNAVRAMVFFKPNAVWVLRSFIRGWEWWWLDGKLMVERVSKRQFFGRWRDFLVDHYVYYT